MGKEIRGTFQIQPASGLIWTEKGRAAEGPAPQAPADDGGANGAGRLEARQPQERVWGAEEFQDGDDGVWCPSPPRS